MSAAENIPVENAIDAVTGEAQIRLFVSKLVNIAVGVMGTNAVFYRNIFDLYAKRLQENVYIRYTYDEAEDMAIHAFFIMRAGKLFTEHNVKPNHYVVNMDMILRENILVDASAPLVPVQHLRQLLAQVYSNIMFDHRNLVSVGLSGGMLNVLGEVVYRSKSNFQTRQLDVLYGDQEDNERCLPFLLNKPVNIRKQVCEKIVVIMKDQNIVHRLRGTDSYIFNDFMTYGLNLHKLRFVPAEDIDRLIAEIMDYTVRDDALYDSLHENNSYIGVRDVKQMVHDSIANGFNEDRDLIPVSRYHPLLPYVLSHTMEALKVFVHDGIFKYNPEVIQYLADHFQGINRHGPAKSLIIAEKLFNRLKTCQLIVIRQNVEGEVSYAINYHRLLRFPLAGVPGTYGLPPALNFEYILSNDQGSYLESDKLSMVFSVDNTGNTTPFPTSTSHFRDVFCSHHPMLRDVLNEIVKFVINRNDRSLHSIRKDLIVYDIQNNCDRVLSQPPFSRSKIAAMFVSKAEELGILAKQDNKGTLLFVSSTLRDLWPLAPFGQLIGDYRNDPLEVVLAPRLRSDSSSSSSSISTDEENKKLESTVKTLTEKLDVLQATVVQLKNEVDVLKTINMMNNRNSNNNQAMSS